MYIGSTVQELSQRMTDHRKHYKQYLQGKRNYVNSFTMFDEFGVDNCQILLLEMYPCTCKAELHKKEGEYILNHDCVNKHVPGRTKAEYYKQNLNSIKDKKKEYYEQSKHKIIVRQLEYYQQNKDTLKQQRKYCYERNRDKEKSRMKEYDEQHKDKI